MIARLCITYHHNYFSSTGGYYQRRVNQLATMVTDRAVYRPGETIYLKVNGLSVALYVKRETSRLVHSKVFVRSPETGSIPSLPHLRCWITFDSAYTLFA